MNDEKIKNKKYLKKNSKVESKGITLIALVITIIVLLILAGISIATLTGQNGILTQANRAKEETRIGEIVEQVDLWNIEKEMAKQTNQVATSEEEFLQELKDNGIVKESEIDRENQIIKIGDEEIYYGGEVELTDIYVALYTGGTLVFNNKNEFDNSMIEENYGNIKGQYYKYGEKEAPWYDYSMDITKVVFLSKIVPSSTAAWFVDCWHLKTVENSGYLKVDKVTDMSFMFSYCAELENFDVSRWNVSNVTDMNALFNECYKIQELDVSKWNVSNVTNMRYLFASCEEVQVIDVSNWNTENVTNMDSMFRYLYKVSNLDVSKFKTSKVTNMGAMFQDNEKVSYLDVSNFDTSNVTNMSDMFWGCSIISDLDVSNFDTSKVTSMDGMFGKCTNISKLDLSNFDTSKVTRMDYMFDRCTNISKLDLSNFDTSKVTWTAGMFRNISNLNGEITIMGSVEMDNPWSYREMFKGTSTNSGAQFIVNYVAETSLIVDTLIDTKDTNSNVVKGEEKNV